MKEVMLSTAALFVFCISTLIFFIAHFFSEKSSKISDTTFFYLYLFFVFFTQLGFNIGITRIKCSCTQLFISFIGTIFPWLLVFFLTIFLLMKFPGWKTPFSNTFGYFIVYIFGIRTLLTDKILKPITTHFETPYKNDSTAEVNNIKGADYYLAIQHIYDNPSLFINEITPENFEQFWAKFSGPLFKANANAYKYQLKRYIIIKDTVSELIWYLLSGVLSMSISYAYINNATCSLPSASNILKDTL